MNSRAPSLEATIDAAPALRSPDELAAAAVTLAARLAADADLDERGAPQWMGDEVDVAASTEGTVLRRGLVDDGLLTGRAGIALAFATAARLSGDAVLAQLSHATIDDVLRARRTVRHGGLGWQSGDLGIATAAERIGALLDAPLLVARGRRLGVRAVTTLATADDSWLPGYPDLLDGSAGHLLAVLGARLPASAGPARAAAAARLVEDLRRRAVTDDLGARWPMAGGDRAVTGLAHGSSGIGLALLAARTAGIAGAEDGLIDAAWAWEAAWYGDDDGGWYDLRLDEPVLGLAWCHGAPGIGLAAALRFRAGAGGEDVYLRAVRSVARTRRDRPRGHAADATADATMCHGRAGIVELHLAGAEAFARGTATRDPEHLHAARAEASVIAAGVRPDGSTTWAHGVPDGRSPAVLDGTAGVVLTLARCVEPFASVAQPPFLAR